MDKNCTVKDFVVKYEKLTNDTDKTKFFKTELKVETYLSYADKLTVAENIVKNSSYAIVKKDDGELIKTNKIKINSPIRYVLFAMTVIDKYTNIAVNFKDVITDFDCLNKNSLLEIIFKKIGEKEIGEFNTVLDMVLDDFMTNEYEFKNYISDVMLKIDGMITKIIPTVDNFVNKIETLSEDDIDKLHKLFERFGKLIK